MLVFVVTIAVLLFFWAWGLRTQQIESLRAFNQRMTAICIAITTSIQTEDHTRFRQAYHDLVALESLYRQCHGTPTFERQLKDSSLGEHYRQANLLGSTLVEA